MSDNKQRLPAFDRALCLALAVYGVVVLMALLAVPQFFLPAEDAVILHQYSRNVAEHGVISYYAGGPHTEGATDFLWMLLVAASLRCGLSPTTFTAAVNFVCLLFLGLALVGMAGVRAKPSRVLIVAGAAGLLPQMVAAGAGFAVLPDALLLTLLVTSFMRQRTALTAALGLLVCLFRPDGIVVVVPLLVFLLLPPGNRVGRTTRVLAFFVLPGLAYFLWRLAYFHALFPLPFTVKSDVHRTLGVLVLHSFTASLKFVVLDCLLLLPLFWPRPRPLLHPATRLLGLSLVVVPTVFYWAMRLDQNVGDRFFFYLPLAAALILAVNWPLLPLWRRQQVLRIGFVAVLICTLAPLLREFRSFRDYQFNQVAGIAVGLRGLPARGSLLTTEAGFITYGSGWVAYDAWGLNTQRFAQHLIQPADVLTLHPDLIVLHPDPPESCQVQPQWLPAYTSRSWPNMTRNLIRGASNAGDYQLWVIPYGSDFYRRRKHWTYGDGDRECLLVREGSPLFARMVTVLRQHHAIGPPQSNELEAARSHASAGVGK